MFMPSGKNEMHQRAYSLSGQSSVTAIENGLAEADWYRSPVPREQIRRLLERRNGPAIRDTLLWFTLLGLTAYGTLVLWGSGWAALPYAIYAVLYATASDSRWHETGHGTAFATDWMNNVLYEIASFMVMRESVLWRWSHTRHHSDTIIVGRDPEIQVPRPPNMRTHLGSLFCLGNYRTYFSGLLRHAYGILTADERSYVPESEFAKITRHARIIVALHLAVIGVALWLHSWLLLFLVIFPHFFGTWLMILHNTIQHAGLAENVLDHRLNCRTVYMNPLSRFIYWNMNYHLEHHMYPLVPYHALPRLHVLVKEDCPPPYPSILSAWRELFPAILRQRKDPTYYVKRDLPKPTPCSSGNIVFSEGTPDSAGWIEVADASRLGGEDVIRFDHGKKTYALVRDHEGKLFALDGTCTHGNTHLSDGLVKGNIIECPKHNGRFHLADGSPARAPICRGLATYPLEARAGKLFLNVSKPGGAGARPPKTISFRVVSNQNVATFIKELILEPLDKDEMVAFTPGDYLQINIPAYDMITFRQFDIPELFALQWEQEHAFDRVARNPQEGRRNNYSIASNRATERSLRFNIRISMPPSTQDVPPGIGSSYLFQLKPDDAVSAIGPFGDFHIKPTQKEMVYIGGGAGMAPLRAHLAHLFETEKTARRVRYWYGARSRQELFYQDYFTTLAKTHANFHFTPVLSAPLAEDRWHGATGFVHDVVYGRYLKTHPRPKAVEFYLCGPPMMIDACTTMLADLGVGPEQIAFDAF
jgi:Na+-transporting NADH:ubiquinone oxidoreductase subunit F